MTGEAAPTPDPADQGPEAFEAALQRAAESERQLIMVETELQFERTAHAIERAARRLGFIDTEDAVVMVGWEGITLDETGVPDPESLEQALQTLVHRKPYLVGPWSGAGGNGHRDINELVREEWGRS